jgi:hypothetical protein
MRTGIPLQFHTQNWHNSQLTYVLQRLLQWPVDRWFQTEPRLLQKNRFRLMHSPGCGSHVLPSTCSLALNSHNSVLANRPLTFLSIIIVPLGSLSANTDALYSAHQAEGCPILGMVYETCTHATSSYSYKRSVKYSATSAPFDSRRFSY